MTTFLKLDIDPTKTQSELITFVYLSYCRDVGFHALIVGERD